jgi:nitrogen regulatory protein PII-like uncharacterized protein
MVLDKLLKCGINKGCFKIKHISKISEIKDGRWDIKFVSVLKKLKLHVIDFDETKELYCRKRKCGDLKSCDALMISPKNRRIDFIEFKIIKSKSKESTLLSKMNKYKIEDKIHDSIHILNDIALVICNLNSNGTEKHEYYKVPIYVGVAMNINFDNGIQGFYEALNHLGENSSSITLTYDDETVEKLKDIIENIGNKCKYKVKVFPINLENIDNHYKGIIDEDLYFPSNNL